MKTHLIRRLRREPRPIGLQRFRHTLHTELIILHSRLPRRAARWTHRHDEIYGLICWYRQLEEKLKPASADEVFQEWQVGRPSWLGRRRANVALDTSRTD